MHFLPILSTLRRHRTAATLIVLEIALTCAIVCNAIFLIRERLGRMDRPSGVAESELVRVQIAGIRKDGDAGAITQQDLVALAAIPGVKSVTNANMVPFGNSSWNNSISTIRHDSSPPVNAATYMGGTHLIETYGLALIAGRDFTPGEYVDFAAVQSNQTHVPAVIISRGIAERLFPGQSPLGHKLYGGGDEPQIVVGVIDHLSRPNEGQGPENTEFAMILPVRIPYTEASNYVLRVDPARRAEVLAAVDATLDKVDASRVVLHRQTFDELRHDYFRADRAMAYLLAGVTIALLVITALGVVGLASFWVQRRTRQIGIRRALGATRGDILRYFQTENFILVTLGIIAGMGLAYAINLWLMGSYHVPRLPAEFLPIGAALLWTLGQIAVLGPALRASLIPPAIATRTV